MSDLETMIPSEPPSVTVRGETVFITPIRVKQLSLVTKTLAGLGKMFDSKKSTHQQMMMMAFENADQVAHLCCACLGKEADWMDDCDAEELVEVFGKVLEVNLDFFIQRVFPSVSRVTAAILKDGVKAGLIKNPMMSAGGKSSND